jgi:hypothetical protein
MINWFAISLSAGAGKPVLSGFDKRKRRIEKYFVHARA